MRPSVRLLIMDEQRDFYDAVRDYADVVGHEYDVQCEFASSELQVEQLMRDFVPSVIIVDMHVPELDVIKILNQSKRGMTPVLATSDSHSEHLEVSAKSLGAMYYVDKGTAPEELENLFSQLASFSTKIDCSH